jgi:AAA domain/Topoisomerase DNA binding C4 zinc finger/PLD-like domain
MWGHKEASQMPNRPFLNFSGDQIRQVFDENQDNLEVLKQVLVELQRRSTPKMKALRSKVEEKISELTGSASGLKTEPPPKSSPPKHVLRQSQPPKPEQKSMFGDEYKPHGKTKRNARSSAVKAEAKDSASSNNKEIREETLRGPRMGKMRKPGKLDGVPAKRQFDFKDEVKLEIRKDAPLVERYEAGVKALVAEMRYKKTAFKQIVLEDGLQVQLDGKENGYQFPYNDDAELFEGAAVIAVVGDTQSEGRIVASPENQIVIALQGDFGPRIAACLVRIDNTAMLEALRGRLEKIAKGEATTFNTKLAESVIFNIGDELAPAFVPAEYVHDLNAYQKEAISKILANEVFYLWGPPGTGKTKTLSALCLALIEGSKRILLCSNTNKAVDQVLLKLCKRFGRQHPAIAEGHIIRVGQIADMELRQDWAEHITVDGIVERKSRTLLDRKEELETKLERINASVARATELMKAYTVLDGLIADREHVITSLQEAQTDRNSVIERKRSMEKRCEALQAEKQKVQLAGAIMRTFSRSIEAIEKDLQLVGADLLTQEKHVESAEQKLRDLKERLSVIDVAIHQAKQAVVGVDQKQVEHQIEQAEDQKRPLIEEISDINKQLEDIRKSIMDGARIVGATVTKAYLSSQLFSVFDVVIVDEASMVMLPALFNAAGLAKEKVVISGDFRQLAPIVQTEQKAIFEAVGGDVFRSTKIATMKEQFKKRLVMLKEQYRMDDQICRLISSRMYKNDLQTAASRSQSDTRPPLPFDGPFTLVDTSPIWPFVNRDPFNSRYNLMNALAVRNLCRFLKSCDYLQDTSRVGVCTPYAAQCKVLQRILAGSGLEGAVDVGTVHRYQGDEKHVMVIDIPDSHGEKRAGVFLDADHVDDAGAMLFNVAVSRAKGHLIIFANLAYLDQKLPGFSILRGILSEMQDHGTVVDVRDVLAMYPITEDLRRLGRPFNLSPDAEKTGLFNQHDFEQVCRADLERARRCIAIFSGFVTEQRVASYEALFRQKKAEGVAIRCVTRPPKNNGSIPVEQGKAALDGLERLGCVVDTRGEIHEKVVVIDDEIVWFGSLNPLSHTARTDEVMARIEGGDLALQISAFMALDRGVRPDAAEGISTRVENPRCPNCGARTSYRKGPYGPYWDCEECTWRENLDRHRGQRNASGQQTGEAPQCDKCGAPMKLRSSRHGEFYGCTAYPACKNKMNVN